MCLFPDIPSPNSERQIKVKAPCTLEPALTELGINFHEQFVLRNMMGSKSLTPTTSGL